MKVFIIIGVLAYITMVTGHVAYSYANLNQASHGGYGSGGYDGGYGGGYDGGYGGGYNGGYSNGYGGQYGQGESGVYDRHVGDAGYGGHVGLDDGHYDSYPEYKYEYGVKDDYTGDHHDAWEHRDGDVVKGGYSLAEADGTKRVVEYTADKHNGFNAIVKRIGHAVHPQVYGHDDGYGAGYGYANGYSNGHGY